VHRHGKHVADRSARFWQLAYVCRGAEFDAIDALSGHVPPMRVLPPEEVPMHRSQRTGRHQRKRFQ